MTKMHVKKGDTVVVLSGKYEDKYEKPGQVKTAKVVEVSLEEGKVIVEGVHQVKKHVKAKKQGDTSAIVTVDAPIYACKVQLYCPDCKKGVRSKVVTDGDKKVRACVKCGHKFD